MGTTGYPFATAALTSRTPGSESAGVPASETSAMSCRARRCRMDSSWRPSLWACRLIIGVRRPKWVSSFCVCLVSSAATSGTDSSTCTARSVMSSRLPIGVATR